MGVADVLFFVCLPAVFVVYEVGYFKYRRQILATSLLQGEVSTYDLWLTIGGGKWPSLAPIGCAVLQLESKKLLSRDRDTSPYLRITPKGREFLDMLETAH